MSTFNTDFVNFLENGDRYEVEIFRLIEFFNVLSNDISHVELAENFIISTCLRYVIFDEEYNRRSVETIP